jgi:hypothetical protein
MATLKLFGRGWNPQSVVGMTEEAFVNDKAHAYEGLTPEDNANLLKEVYASCKAATGGVEPAPDEAGSRKGTGKK